MKITNELRDTVIKKAIELGAFKAAVIPASEIVTDVSFRDICAKNSCGMYGRCWTCPPDAGDINDLIEDLKKYEYMFIYQIVGNLEDSFDIEGMQECAKEHNRLAQKLRKVFADEGVTDRLHLGAGGCHMCDVCAKRTNEPCRHPDLALSSLETYGIYVAKTAEKADMKYINGQNTVTYFGAVFFNL